MSIEATGSVNTALTSIQTNTALQSANLQHLSTGRKVNGLSDNPPAFSLAEGLLGRAGTLADIGNSIGQGIGVLEAANNGLNAIGGVVNQLKALAQQAAASSDSGQIKALQDQYNSLAGQIDSLAADSSYGGANLIAANPGKLTVPGLSSGTGTTIVGQAADAAALGVTPAANWATNSANISSDLAKLSGATSQLQSRTASLGGNLTELKIQASFTQGQGNIARQGAAGLTGVDAYQAAANAVAAGAYRQLGQAALRNAVQNQSSVLTLIGKS
ncbi:MAG: hypothetical protein HY055_17800 [Magnetospirillum sp.]|nr:hypothetical protein [Magnetospirillum sp.]